MKRWLPWLMFISRWFALVIIGTLVMPSGTGFWEYVLLYLALMALCKGYAWEECQRRRPPVNIYVDRTTITGDGQP